MKKFLCTVLSAILIVMTFTSCADKTSARVEITDMKFTVNGSELWINGMNTPWHHWNDFVGGTSTDAEFWDREFARLAENNVNCTRVWISCCGEGAVKLDDNGGIVSINEEHWNDLDKLFDLSEKYKVYLMPTFLSFDHFKAYNGGYERWRKLISNNETCDDYAEKYVKEFCERYKDREYIFAVDIMNEPDWVYENEECGQIDWDHLSYFFGKCAQVIHENSDILVTVGMGIIKYNSDKYEGNKVSDEYLYELTGSDKAYLDFYSTHYYLWQKPWFGFPCDKSPEDFGLDGTKPCLIGETHCDDEADIGMTLEEKYQSVYDNAWCGIMVWSQTSEEEYVWYGYDRIEKAANYMAEYIPDKIHPLG